MVWLWGVNVWVFLQSNVSYPKVFDIDLNHFTHKEIWKVVEFPTLVFYKTLFTAKCKNVRFILFLILTINILTMELPVSRSLK